MIYLISINYKHYTINLIRLPMIDVHEMFYLLTNLHIKSKLSHFGSMWIFCLSFFFFCVRVRRQNVGHVIECAGYVIQRIKNASKNALYCLENIIMKPVFSYGIFHVQSSNTFSMRTKLELNFPMWNMSFFSNKIEQKNMKLCINACATIDNTPNIII